MPSVAPVGFDVPGMHESMPETKAISFANNSSEFFENLLDIVNPLQHIPVVSTIYRAVTGDQIAAPARLIGGALFGGPLGFATASANLLLEDVTGSDLAGHALAFVGDLGDAPEFAAAAFTPPAPQAAIDLVAADGGIEIVPELATAAASTAAATLPIRQASTDLATADGGVEIIWNGPRVLPSLASAAPVRGGAVGDAAVDIADIGAAARDVAPVEHDGSPFGTSKTSAAAPNLDARPAWLEAAIADAQSVQDAAQLGKAARKVNAQPWVTQAMLDALSKYETLARERNR